MFVAIFITVMLSFFKLIDFPTMMAIIIVVIVAIFAKIAGKMMFPVIPSVMFPRFKVPVAPAGVVFFGLIVTESLSMGLMMPIIPIMGKGYAGTYK